MLRDIITGLPGLGTWPCDEINFIWRHGNTSVPHDEFTPEHAQDKVKSYIRTRFDRLAKRLEIDQVVEKTCANSLRVSFVESVLPDARYLYIVRDGRDATASAMQRWRSKMDLMYTLRKARFVPVGDIPIHALRFARSRLLRGRSEDRRVASWGPRFIGIDEIARSGPLHEVCALQWKRCIDLSDSQLKLVDPSRVHRLRYEDFISDPAAHIENAADFLRIRVTPELATHVTRSVTAGNVGKWKSQLTNDQQEDVTELLASPLQQHGYL